MKKATQRILTALGLALAVAGLGTFSAAEAGQDPTQSLWYRSTNWVDKPPVQRYIAGSTRVYQENKQVIWGTAKGAAQGKSLPQLIFKGVFGYPKTAR